MCVPVGGLLVVTLPLVFAVQEGLQQRGGAVLLALSRQRRRLAGLGLTGGARRPRGAGLRHPVHRLVHVLLQPEGRSQRGGEVTEVTGVTEVTAAADHSEELQHAEQETITGWEDAKDANANRDAMLADQPAARNPIKSSGRADIKY